MWRARFYPAKIAALAKLGDERGWCWVRELTESMARFFDAPKVWTPEALADGIAEGVQQGTFGYVADATQDVGSLSVSPSAVRLREPLPHHTISLEGQAALLRVTLAEELGRAHGEHEPTPNPQDGPGLFGTAPKPSGKIRHRQQEVGTPQVCVLRSPRRRTTCSS